MSFLADRALDPIADQRAERLADEIRPLLAHADVAQRERRSTSTRIQSVDRAIRLLKAIVDSPVPLTLGAVARTADVNPGTAWRLLATLGGPAYRIPLPRLDEFGALLLQAATELQTALS